MTRIFLQEGRVPIGGVLPNGETIPAQDIPKKYPVVPVAIKDTILVNMWDAPDVYSPDPEDPVYMQHVGFQLVDTEGAPVKVAAWVELSAWDDVKCTVLSAHAYLFNATKGLILAGESTCALKVETDANGEFSCLLHCNQPQTVWLATDSTAGGPFLHCGERDTVTFHHHPVA